jgi:hypothetical protein
MAKTGQVDPEYNIFYKLNLILEVLKIGYTRKFCKNTKIMKIMNK